MSRISFNRKRAKLKQLLGIRGRLVLLALIMVVPLMLERARSLEDTRAKQITFASNEYKKLAEHSAASQREVVSSVEAVMKSSAYIYALGTGAGQPCAILRASLHVELPWIRTLSIADKRGVIECSTMPSLVGLDLGDREYIKRAVASRQFVLSDYLFSRATQQPAVIAAYPVAAIDSTADTVVVAGLNLNWMSRVMNNLGGRPGVTAVLVDGEGVVLAAPDDLASTVTHPLEDKTLLPAIIKYEAATRAQSGALTHIGPGGRQKTVSFARVPGTDARLIVRIEDAAVTAAINRDIRSAYAQLGFVVVFVLFGALVVAEGLIVKPIRAVAATAVRFGRGDNAARTARKELPAEFVPLARAFNAMAAQLGQRERELLASNNRLTVMASIDVVSGLANRRGFQSRFDFEWLKAAQNEADLAVLMLDVDHFKLFNDSYGHPEGDICLGRLGATLEQIAGQTAGFAARYGGEEFCMLLPDTSPARALEIGNLLRTAVEGLAMPHSASSHQTVTVSVGVACARPNDALRPNDLIEAADAALYAAKRRGRNTVVLHGQREMPDPQVSLAS
jgi:diguanylate cyclase (GGDEF)-like protein